MQVETLEAILDEKFKGQNSLLEEKFKYNDACHERVETQVKYTNGRVRKLEKFMYALGGAVGILGWQITNVEGIKNAVIALTK